MLKVTVKIIDENDEQIINVAPGYSDEGNMSRKQAAGLLTALAGELDGPPKSNTMYVNTTSNLPSLYGSITSATLAGQGDVAIKAEA